jgi:TonB-linked SusC/RagA family outer membrane protein
MRKVLFFLSCVLLLVGRITAQNRTITGTVLDANGAPVPGASITVKGTNVGTTTGIDGSFTLRTNEDAKTLVISAINFTTQEINVGGRAKIGAVNLQTASKNLSEVVVVAYGTQRKTNVTGAVATVTGAAVADKPFTSVDKALQGDVAGVQVTSSSGAPGSATDIRIRGIGSINASSAPLWVIDGVISTTSDISVNTTTANPLSTLNPDDIESISVLKDAAATAPYGSRGANGVIIVTTKKGRAGKTRFNIVGEFGQNSRAYTPSNKPENTAQMTKTLSQALINAGYSTPTSVATDIPGDFGWPSNYGSYNTNWFNAASQKGPQEQVNMSLSGGDEKTQVYASAGYFVQQGISLASSFNRWSGAISVTHHASDRFTLTADITGSNTAQHTPFNGGYFANPVLASYFLLPWYTPYNPNGTLRYGASDTLGEFPVSGGLYNPVVQAKLNRNLAQQTALRGSVTGEEKILEGLKLTSRLSAEYLAVQEDQYFNPFYGDGYGTQGSATSNYTRDFTYTWSNFADWRQKVNHEGDMYFDLKAGVETYDSRYYTLQAAGRSFPLSQNLQYLASAATPLTAYALPSETTTFSEFAIADYNIKDRYVLSASLRRDESSVFGTEHRWGTFYSVGGTWNLNEEAFMKQQDLFSLLKIRASYGQAGNTNGFPGYTQLGTFASNSNYNYQGTPGLALNNVGDSALTWEKNESFNVGVDFSMLKDRLSGTLEYYDRKTVNLLSPVPFSQTAGISSQNENIGSIDNKGPEITITGRPIVTHDFSWSISINAAHNVNKVLSLYGGKPVPNGVFEYTVGHDLNQYYMEQWAGVNSQTGAPEWYVGGNSKNQITGDYDSAGLSLNHSASPTWFGGLSNTFTYKGFSLDFLFSYNFGNYIYDEWYNYLNSDGEYAGSFNQMTHQLNAWTTPGQKTDVPQVIYGDPSGSNQFSSRWLYKGDYIRLRNLQFSYNLPSDFMKRLHLANVSLYIRGTNLLTFGTDKNLPYDPEAGVNSTANLEVVIPKTVAGGIRVGF